MAKDKITCITLSRPEQYNLVELATDEDLKHHPLLRRVFKEKLVSVLERDPNPVLILARNLLDEGPVIDGEKTFTWGWYGYHCPEALYLSDVVEALQMAPGYRGHIPYADWTPSPLTCVWAGLDEKNGLPAAILYCEPDEVQMREKIRTAAVLGNLHRKFPLSLAVPIEVNYETNMVTGVVDPERSSIDLVRHAGTRSARVEEALTLSHTEEGDREMGDEKKTQDGLHFLTLQAALAHPDIQARMEAEIAKRMKESDTVKAIVLSADIEIVKQHEKVKPLLALESRDKVLSKLGADDVPHLLKGLNEAGEDVKLALVKGFKDHNDSIERFRKDAMAELTKPEGEAKLDDATAAILLSAKPELLSRMDMDAVKQAKQLALKGVGNATATEAVGESQSAELGKHETSSPPLTMQELYNYLATN